MASQDFVARAVPTDVVAALSLVSSTRYTCQNVSTIATLFVREAVAMPAVTDMAFRIEAGGNFTINPDGTPIWMWTDNGSCPVVLDDAP